MCIKTQIKWSEISSISDPPTPRYENKQRIPLGEWHFESSVITGTHGVLAFSGPCIHVEKVVSKNLPLENPTWTSHYQYKLLASTLSLTGIIKKNVCQWQKNCFPDALSHSCSSCWQRQFFLPTIFLFYHVNWGGRGFEPQFPGTTRGVGTTGLSLKPLFTRLNKKSAILTFLRLREIFGGLICSIESLEGKDRMSCTSWAASMPEEELSPWKWYIK